MKTPKSIVMLWLSMGALCVAASAPVAMRVEVEPLRQSGDKTEVAVIVQVSPEDRGRIGSNAIVRIELDAGAVSSGSPMRAVRLGEDGNFRVVVEWPPGEHDLRVQIEDPSKEDTGLWVGRVRIPNLAPDAAASAAPEPDPQPASEPPETVIAPEIEKEEAIEVPVEAAAASTPVEPPIQEPSSEPAPEIAEMEDAEEVGEVPEAGVEAEPDLPKSEAAVTAGLAAAGAAATPEDRAPTGPEERAPAAESEPDPVAAVPQPALEEPPVIEAKPEIGPPDEADAVPEPEPEAIATADDAESLPIEAPAEAEEELPIVEPLRADPPSRNAEPEAVRPGSPAAPAPPAVAMSAEMEARHAAWKTAESDTRDISVVVMRGREPALDLEPSDLRLRVGGSEVPIESLGDAESAPLLLGLAVDVASDDIGGWSGSRGSLGPLAERASGGRGLLFVATHDGVGGWGGEPEVPGQSRGAPVGSNVARLVVASLEPFSGQRGRTFLVVLTDGRNEPTKAEWTEATEAAASAGVPILVVALWDDDFSHRTRKNLKQLTVVSGGSLFLVQGSTQLDSAADRFGRLIDGSYALRFRSPLGPQEKATAISVTTNDKGLDVTAPKSIR